MCERDSLCSREWRGAGSSPHRVAGSSLCLLQGGWSGTFPGLLTTEVLLAPFLGFRPVFVAWLGGSFSVLTELEPCLRYPLVWPGGLRWCLEPLGRPWSVGPWVSLGAEPLALVVRSGPGPFILQPLAHSAILPPPWSFLSGMCSGQVPPSICASPLQGHPGDSKFFPYHTGSEGSSGKLNASPSTV